ncbi:unnamed protein product [Callosobruchus maculatus]|uniref:Uncharacterized protein n=1 Tax=Callosobruchus maculatus TaxID=64391 RepID=A0A653D5C4_CALMS|nr:unnamed protein product [Callosobruchus maculatus]
MATVWKALASAKRAGKDWTALKWTKKRSNAFLIAQDMARLILRLKHARVNRGGLVTIAQKNYAIWIVVDTGIVSPMHVSVTLVGQASSAISRNATPGVTNMVNVRTEPVFVSPVGMENIALLKVVQTAVQVTVSADSAQKECGSVDVMQDGTAEIAGFYWNRIAMTGETTTKMDW